MKKSRQCSVSVQVKKLNDVDQELDIEVEKDEEYNADEGTTPELV